MKCRQCGGPIHHDMVSPDKALTSTAPWLPESPDICGLDCLMSWSREHA